MSSIELYVLTLKMLAVQGHYLFIGFYLPRTFKGRYAVEETLPSIMVKTAVSVWLRKTFDKVADIYCIVISFLSLSYHLFYSGRPGIFAMMTDFSVS